MGCCKFKNLISNYGRTILFETEIFEARVVCYISEENYASPTLGENIAGTVFREKGTHIHTCMPIRHADKRQGTATETFLSRAADILDMQRPVIHNVSLTLRIALEERTDNARCVLFVMFSPAFAYKILKSFVYYIQ